MKNYWLDLFTFETWQEFLTAGAKVSGFRDRRWNTVQRMKPGDILLCYLTGVSRWIGLLQVTGNAYRDNTVIWSRNDFPARVPVTVMAKLNPIDGVPVVEMKDRLSAFRNIRSPHAWTGRFRGSPAQWSREDGEAVVAAVMAAVSNPVARPFDERKLAKVPPILKSKVGEVTVPDNEEDMEVDLPTIAELPIQSETSTKEVTAHTEIQWLLLHMGSEIGLDVWVAKNDRNRTYTGSSLGAFARSRQSLPMQFDEATNRTIELIDVLWLKDNSIQAAFEIESTTQVFSGLLRMADLITMQPNLAIPLYIVAPSDRPNKVRVEVNRPTFRRLNQPMAELCRFISFEDLRFKVNEAGPMLKYLKPEFLDSFSESCEIENV
jgi:hypothetical protein